MWRWFTYSFCHGSPLHLGLNVALQILIGVFVEFEHKVRHRKIRHFDRENKYFFRQVVAYVFDLLHWRDLRRFVSFVGESLHAAMWQFGRRLCFDGCRYYQNQAALEIPGLPPPLVQCRHRDYDFGVGAVRFGLLDLQLGDMQSEYALDRHFSHRFQTPTTVTVLRNKL